MKSKEIGKDVASMNRVEDIIAASKLNDILKKKDDNDKTKNTVLWVLAIVGAVAAIAGIAYAVYCFFTPDYLEDFEEDFDDEFDDDFFSEEDEILESAIRRDKKSRLFLAEEVFGELVRKTMCKWKYRVEQLIAQ